MTRIAVTGIGLVTALAQGAEANWAAMRAGRSGVRPIARFGTEGLKTRFAASIDLPGDRPGHPLPAPTRARILGEAAIVEALAQAGLATPFGGGMFLGLAPVEIEWPQRLELNGRDYAGLIEAVASRPDLRDEFHFGATAARLAARFGARGVPVAVTTACASGASALQMAIEAMRRGECEHAIVAGAEASLQPETLIRFSLLQALSTRNEAPEKASRPFSLSRDGFVMADGAGALVLETEPRVRARGASVLGFVAGAGEAADTFHRTRSSPDGGAIIRAMARAVADAGLEPSAIGYLNAHGTSTPENDRMEAMAICALWNGAPPPVSSTKSMIGHTLSAAGAIEAAVCLLALRDQVLPPTINGEDPDPEIALDTVPVSRPHRFRAALSNSFGFGGQNVSVVLLASD